MYKAVHSERENWRAIFGEILPYFKTSAPRFVEKSFRKLRDMMTRLRSPLREPLWNRGKLNGKTLKLTADAGFVYYIFPVKTDAVLRENNTGVHCIVRDLRFYPRVTTKNTASIKLVEIYQRLGEISLSYHADGGGRFMRNAAKFYTRSRGSTSNKHRSSNYTSTDYLPPGRLNILLDCYVI